MLSLSSEDPHPYPPGLRVLPLPSSPHGLITRDERKHVQYGLPTTPGRERVFPDHWWDRTQGIRFVEQLDRIRYVTRVCTEGS